MKATPSRPQTEMLTGRDAAVHVVRRALSGQGFAERGLRALRAGGRLAGRDQSLASETARGALRHFVTIEHVLRRVARYDPRRTSEPLRAILALAAYQVIWLDRVPAFAAVDQAVDQARRMVHARAAGMANAVLRNLTRGIAQRRGPWERLNPRHVRVSWDAACIFAHPVLPDPAAAADARDAPTRAGGDAPAPPRSTPPAPALIAHLAAASGEADGWFRALVERVGLERAEQIAWARQATPVTVVRRNTLGLMPAEFTRRAAERFGPRADVLPAAVYVPADAPLLDWDVFRDGHAYIQDVAAYAAARLLNARPGERVLDLCAAPGGKSITIALQMQARGQIVACDVEPARVRRIEENARRLRLTSIKPVLIDAQSGLGELVAPRLGDWPRRPSRSGRGEASARPAISAAAAADAGSDLLRGEPFDAVIADVPCSNTGVVARRPEARLHLGDRKLAALTALQARLIRQAATFVRPGGRLVYSTCSLERAENESIIEQFLADHGGPTAGAWRVLKAETHWPAWGPQPSDWRDGGFAALLKRLAE